MIKALENYISLSSKIELYVPSTINVNEEFDNTEYVKKTAVLFSECFGGASAESLLGYWMSDSEGLVTEKTVKVYSNCTTEDLEKHMDKVVKWANTIREELNQESVGLAVNNTLFFIKAE